MQALDSLLLWFRSPDHAKNLDLFVDSYLTIVRKLLESEEPELHILACSSFIKFANIEEDSPSYHRSYDFFISRFRWVGMGEEADLVLNFFQFQRDVLRHERGFIAAEEDPHFRHARSARCRPQNRQR